MTGFALRLASGGLESCDGVYWREKMLGAGSERTWAAHGAGRGAIFTKLSWTWEDHFMLQPLEKNFFWPRAWEILGQVQHLFCSKARQS